MRESVLSYQLGVDNRGAFNAPRIPDNQRITLRPVSAVDRVQPHPSIAHMDLEPIAVMLQLMRPAGARRGLGDNGLTRMNESGSRIRKNTITMSDARFRRASATAAGD